MGYYDHPPMVAWWISISTRVLGNTELGVRLFAIMAIPCTSIAVYDIALQLFASRKIARFATIWLNAMFLINLELIFATPDAPSTLFWTLTVWALVRQQNTGRPAWWLLIGTFAGLGCLSKYTNLFMGIGILSWLALNPTARSRHLLPWILAGGLIAVTIFSPVLIWNWQHDWVSFAKQFGRVTDRHPGVIYFVEFVGGQLGLINPVIAVFSALAILGWRRNPPGRTSVGFLITLNAPLVLYMVVHSLHDRVHANWPVPAYPSIAIIAATAADGLKATRHLRRLSYWAAPVGIGLSSLLLIFFTTAWSSSLPYEGPADRVLGWTDFSKQIDDVRQKADAQWIATTDYGVTGELAFAFNNRLPVRQIDNRQRYFFEDRDLDSFRRPALLVVNIDEERLPLYLRCFRISSFAGYADRSARTRTIERYATFKVEGMAKDAITKGCGG